MENFQLEGTWTSVSLSHLSLRKYPLEIYFENNSVTGNRCQNVKTLRSVPNLGSQIGVVEYKIK